MKTSKLVYFTRHQEKTILELHREATARPEYFIQNCKKLNDVYPDSGQVSLLELAYSSDIDIWKYARENDFIIVTFDSDFYDLTSGLGSSSQDHLDTIKQPNYKRGGQNSSITLR